MDHCPCNPLKLFKNCCKPFLTHTQIAPTPKALMQSRFSAYATGQTDYLLATWHPSTRPQSVDLSQSPKWLTLQIIHTSSQGNHGIVEFKATYMAENNSGTLHETSRFSKEKGQWFYIDGDLHEPPQGKVGRNDPCPCGSGRKFKKCCG